MVDILVQTKAIEAFCRQAQQHDWVAVDTEFMRRRTYRAQLCLVQLCCPDGRAVLIDCLADVDLTSLFVLLQDSSVLKVFHGARQDLEIFYHAMEGVLPYPLFDTQTAGMLCGYQEMVGLSVLVKDWLGTSLNKQERMSDWSYRPLSLRQQDYALCDVTNLKTLYVRLRADLETRKRLSWMTEEMERITDLAHYHRVYIEDAWRRLAGTRQNRRFLARLRALYAWRESVAAWRDRPKVHIVSNDKLVFLARLDYQEALYYLQKVKRRPAWFDEAIASFEQAFMVADALPMRLCPQPEDVRLLNEESETLYKRLRALLSSTCQLGDVAVPLVARGSELRLLSSGFKRDFLFLRGWRYDFFGSKALSIAGG